MCMNAISLYRSSYLRGIPISLLAGGFGKSQLVIGELLHASFFLRNFSIPCPDLFRLYFRVGVTRSYTLLLVYYLGRN